MANTDPFSASIIPFDLKQRRQTTITPQADVDKRYSAGDGRSAEYRGGSAVAKQSSRLTGCTGLDGQKSRRCLEANDQDYFSTGQDCLRRPKSRQKTGARSANLQGDGALWEL